MTCKRCNLILIVLSHANCDKNNSSLPLNGEQSKLSFIPPFSLLKNISLWRLVMLGWYFVYECWCKHTESIAFDAISRWNYLPYTVKESAVIWEPDQIPIKSVDEKFYLCCLKYNNYWLYILFLVQVVIGHKKLIRQCLCCELWSPNFSQYTGIRVFNFRLLLQNIVSILF